MKPLFLVITIFIVHLSYAQHDHSKHPHKTDTVPKKSAPAPKQAGEKTPAKDTIKKPAIPAKPDDHDHSTHDHGTPMAADTVKKEADSHAGHDHGEATDDHSAHNMKMTHSFSLHLPMNRNGSGTGWLPDNSPVYGYMFHKKDWMMMLHGNLFLRYNSQDLFNAGSRGDARFDAPSWAMLMAERKLGQKSMLHLSGMMSLDPIIAGGKGYPLLFQTGETNKGKPLVDRQHPHDFISELSVSYTYAPSDNSDLFVYIGYPGEPAIGPVAFMHRPSALPNPDATLTHHWTDATHITFGVATLGFRLNNWKIEGSSFTGREPDEERFNFDKPRFDSWSGRLSFNPSAKWAMQVSHGSLKEPEPLHPGEDVARTTASVVYSSRDLISRFFNATALWGVNRRGHHDGENGFLLEGAYTNRRWTPFVRYEWVQKSSEELQIEATHGHDAVFPIQALTTGFNYDLFQTGNTKFAGGGHFTFYNPDDKLNNLYGKNPVSAQVYLRIYPAVMGKKAHPFFIAY